jgi:hypothetical protein
VFLSPDAAAVLGDDAVRDGQAEAAPVARLLGGEERVEDAGQVFLRDAGSVGSSRTPLSSILNGRNA